MPHVEYLIGYEGDAFAATGDPQADLRSIAAVHPLRASAVRDLLRRSDAGWDVVERLIDQGLLVRVEHEGSAFYVRSFTSTSARRAVLLAEGHDADLSGRVSASARRRPERRP